MRKLFLLAAALILPARVEAFSISYISDQPAWVDLFVGFATVTSDVTVGTPSSAVVRQDLPSSFFLQTFFSTNVGPITSSTFNGAVNPTLYEASTSAQQLVVTGATLTGFGPGGADNPIFTYTYGLATIFSFNAGFATFNPTPGSISVFQQSPLLGGLASLNLSQNGSNLDGSFLLSDGNASRTIQFVASSNFQVIYESPGVSAVPLPPALPLFASALLALGASCFWNKRRTRASGKFAVPT